MRLWFASARLFRLFSDAVTKKIFTLVSDSPLGLLCCGFDAGVRCMGDHDHGFWLFRTEPLAHCEFLEALDVLDS